MREERQKGELVRAAIGVAVAFALVGCSGHVGSGEAGGSGALAASDSTAMSSTGSADVLVPTTQRPEDDIANLIPAHAYELEGSHEVDGRQGVAAEGDLVWVSGSATLSCYDAEWNLLATNDPSPRATTTRFTRSSPTA